MFCSSTRYVITNPCRNKRQAYTLNVIYIFAQKYEKVNRLENTSICIILHCNMYYFHFTLKMIPMASKSFC